MKAKSNEEKIEHVDDIWGAFQQRFGVVTHILLREGQKRLMSRSVYLAEMWTGVWERPVETCLCTTVMYKWPNSSFQNVVRTRIQCIKWVMNKDIPIK